MMRVVFLIGVVVVLCGSAMSFAAQEQTEEQTEEQAKEQPGLGADRLQDAKDKGSGADAASWDAAIARAAKRKAQLLDAGVERSGEVAAPAPKKAAAISAAPEAGAGSIKPADADGAIMDQDKDISDSSGLRVELPRYPLRKLREFTDDMQPGRWYPLPGHPSDVAITKEDALRISRGDQDAAERLWGWGGPLQTFNSYSGAAFDGRNVYFFGGGHHMYRGNELTLYDLQELTWKRLYDPSDMTDKTYMGRFRYIPRYGPRSVHVYDGLIYSPLNNSLYLWGWRNIDPWRFDLDVFNRTNDPWQAWKRLEWPEGFTQAMQKTARLPDGKIMVIASGRGSRIVTFDPRRDSYSSVRRGSGHISSLVWRDANRRFYSVSADKYIDEHNPDGTVALEHMAEFPPAYQGKPGLSGMAYDDRHDRIVFWPGQRVVWSWDPNSKIWTQYANPDGPAPTSGHQGIYSKWFYISQFDLFVGMGDDKGGMWAYRLPQTASVNPQKAELEAQGYRCSDEIHGWSCPDLAAQIRSGQVKKGVYVQCATVSGPVDFNDAHLKSKVCGRKAGLIAKAGSVIENVTISDLSIGVNAACVRWEGGDVHLRNVTCRDTDMGLLGTGNRLVIENSLFERTYDKGRNHGHVIYAAKADEVIVRNSVIRDPGNQGHVLKTGARYTLIENSSLSGGERSYSRVIDAFNGGILDIRQSEISVGTNGGNGDMIGYGAEMRQTFDDNRIVIRGGSIDCAKGHTYNSLHIWPERVRPQSVIWEPDENTGCRPPS